MTSYLFLKILHEYTQETTGRSVHASPSAVSGQRKYERLKQLHTHVCIYLQ